MSHDLKSLLLEKVNALIGEIAGSNGSHTDLLQALVQFVNLRDRVPGIRKWIVCKSDHLRKQSLNANISAGLEKLVSAAEAGEDLRPWLHDAIFADKQDALFNDWGIQHYHLGVEFEIVKNGRPRIRRTGDVLFATHREDTGHFYLIGIFDHKNFSNKQLLEIVNANWPELIDHAKIRSLIEISHSPTSSEIHLLRKNQVNSAAEIDGKFFVGPGGGYTTSGQSTKAVMKALYVTRLLYSLQKEVDSKQLEVRFVVQDRSVFLVDETNNRHRLVL
ncbi:hypothetical protein [Tepidimonas ignava]|uniref:hypothetical protein n=1 Tax=Tepidimonas ignava TaxID=114249 RepID=UPI00104C8A94|nr:hypothetical protein [Tepidimonas ignava]